MSLAAFRVASGPCRLQRLLRWWLALCLLAVLPVQGAQAVLQLSGDTPDIDAWPALTAWTDAQGQADLDAALAQRQHFAPPDTPHANLGVRRDAVWLRLQLQVGARDDGRWILDADYPSLDRVEVHVLRNGQLERQAVLGDQLAFDERVLASRSHAMWLPLQPGASYELLLRVQTTSSMIVPLRLMKAEAFHARETRLQMLQGLATGIALCLLVYALAHWVGSREPMFLHYAVMMAGVGLFFFAYYGLAAQYLWPGNRWLTNNMAPLAVLVGLGGGMPLIERLLDLRALQPRMARLLQALAVVAFGAAALFALDLISYRAAHLMGTLLGPMPIVLAVQGAWLRWRQGDVGARYIFAGWAVYLVGVAVMAALLRGWVGSDGVTQHAFQTASLFEALMWLRVLGVRNADARREAERVDREREVLQTLAHTDALTGLPNRRGLEAELAAALPAPDAQRVLAVYLLDLDGFKA
ncbi:MAG: 7TM diverse intracellular signaling domain-containing protein, partial [Rubrivivax sp.]